MRKMDMLANTFYRRVHEYELRHGITEPTSVDRQTNGNVPQSRPPLRSGKLTDEKSALSESSERTLTVCVCLLGICLLWNAP